MSEFVYVIGRSTMQGKTVEHVCSSTQAASHVFYNIREELIEEVKEDLSLAKTEKSLRLTQILEAQMFHLKLCTPDSKPTNLVSFPYIQRMKVIG